MEFTLIITSKNDLAGVGILFALCIGLIIFCLIWFHQNFNTLNPVRIHKKINALAVASKDMDILKDRDTLIVSVMLGLLISGLVLGLVFGFGFIYNMVLGIKSCL